MEKTWIGLLDCNNFFVSCERLFRPDLVGKPVVVLSGNDGCIVARSQEVKDMGIPMGVPYFQVKDTLQKHGTTTFSSHFALYRDVSRRVFAVMRDELDMVQQYSVDEAFFACADPSPEILSGLKHTLEQKVGIPVSIGVAPSKTLAKYVNTLAKKTTGVAIFDAPTWVEVSQKVPISAIWGVGGRMEVQYKTHGIHSVADLITADKQRVKTLFGSNGLRLQAELNGEQILSLDDVQEPQKSTMSSRSFRQNVTDLPTLADAVAYHVRHVMEDVRSMSQKAQVLRVSLRPGRHGDFVLRGGSLESVFTAPTNDTVEMIKEAQKLITQLYEPGVPYKKVGVVLSGLSSDQTVQASLFAVDTQAAKTTALMPIIDSLNKKIGRGSVVIGSRLKNELWQSRSDVRSPAYTTRWSDIQTVTAK